MEREVFKRSAAAVSMILIIAILGQSAFLITVHAKSDQMPHFTKRKEYISMNPVMIDESYNFHNSYFTGSGTRDDPYILSGMIIDGNDYCVMIVNISKYIVFRDIIFRFAYLNFISLNNVSNIRFEDSRIEGRPDGHAIGVISKKSSRVGLHNITFNNLASGVVLAQTDHSVVEDSRIYLNQKGIILTNSSNVILRNNRVFANREYGIYLDQETTNCTVYANEVGWNREGNNIEFHNAFDDGKNNYWYNLSISLGNKWSDYNNTEDYQVAGNAGSLDIYPLILSDTTIPTIDSPQDIIISKTENTHSIIWHPIDEYPYYYEVYREGNKYREGYWDGGPISITPVDRQVGSYNYTIVVKDAAGNTATDTVFSVVAYSILQGVSMGQIILASALSVVWVCLMVICIKKY